MNQSFSSNIQGQMTESSASTSTVKEPTINTSNLNNQSTKSGTVTTSPGKANRENAHR